MTETPAAQPSWLKEACPPWCARDHHETDHPEDRLHRSEGIVFPAVFAEKDAGTQLRTGRAAELVVQQTRALGESEPWVSIVESEDARHSLEISVETTERLIAALVRETSDRTEEVAGPR